MNRIQDVLEKNKEEERKSFIGYLTAGDPSLEQLLPLLKALEEGGCDVIEIGVPFSDPLADGPVIQAAGQRAIEGGTNIFNIFDCLEKGREEIKTPLAFLVYYNTLITYGLDAFIKRCEKIGIDGLIIPDLPYEEQEELKSVMKESQIALIPFATPTSNERMAFTLKDTKGFVYTVSSMGVTGRASDFYADLEAYLDKVKSYSTLPVAIGFGISTPEDVKRISGLADAVIVGTAIVQKIQKENGDTDKVKRFVESLASAM